MSRQPTILPDKKGHCPRCGVRYVLGDIGHPSRPSRDHILPKERGGKATFAGATNIAIMCQDCNTWRAACGHCWGALSCVDAVATAIGTTRRAIYLRWKLQFVSRDEAPRPNNADRRKAARAAVKIGIIVSKVGIDEFIWPADTAAKRIWNLATLARGGYAT